MTATYIRFSVEYMSAYIGMQYNTCIHIPMVGVTVSQHDNNPASAATQWKNGKQIYYLAGADTLNR